MLGIVLMDAMNELSQHKEIPLKRVALGWNKRSQRRSKIFFQRKLNKKRFLRGMNGSEFNFILE